MTTGTDFCTEALRYAGILGQGIEASGEDTAIAKNILNDMLAEWSTRRWLVYHLVDTAHACNGAVNYSVGAGGDVALPTRPERIEYCFVRLLNGGSPTLYTDYPLAQLLAREDYARVSLKQMQSFPYYYFYDAAYPLGFLYLWPIPNNQYELHIGTRAVLPQVDVLADDLNLPPGYDGAVKWNLARRLRVAYRYPADPEVNAMANNGINVVSSNNFAPPTLSIPSGLRGRARYNFYSDQVQ